MKLSICLFFVFSLICSQASEYETSSVSTTYVDQQLTVLSCDISMDSTSNKLTITLVGPSTVWYSVGFGNSYMSKTYSIIVDGDGNVEERYLIGTTSGKSLDDSFTVDSNIVSGSSRTVVLSRDLDCDLASKYHHEFSLDESKIETIYGYGTTSYLENHGENQRGSTTLLMTRKKSSSEKKKGFGNIMAIDLQNRTSLIAILASCVVIAIIIFYVTYKYKKQNQNGYLPLSYNPSSKNRINEEYEEIMDEKHHLVVV